MLAPHAVLVIADDFEILEVAASHEDVHTHVPYRLYDLCSGPSVSRTNDHFPQQNFLSHRYEIVCLPIQLDTIL